MNNTHEILARLPQVTIIRLPDTERNSPGLATCDRKPAIQHRQIDLVSSSGAITIETDGIDQDFKFEYRMAEWEHPGRLTVDTKYPCTPSEFHLEVNLAVDQETMWVWTRHVAEDAYAEKKDDPKHCVRLRDSAEEEEEGEGGLGPYDPSKHKIVPNGWNFDDCMMCWALIGNDERDQWGYKSDDDRWLCRECHTKYIVNRSLDFLAEYASPKGAPQTSPGQSER